MGKKLNSLACALALSGSCAFSEETNSPVGNCYFSLSAIQRGVSHLVPFTREQIVGSTNVFFVMASRVSSGVEYVLGKRKEEPIKETLFGRVANAVYNNPLNASVDTSGESTRFSVYYSIKYGAKN